MKRTRIPSLFLIPFLMVGLLAACGDDKSPSSEASKGSTSDASKLAATTLNASGATFPAPFYEQVIAKFSEKHSGVTINYGGGGSGKGRTDLQTGVVDFAGSDGLVKAEDVPKYKGPFLYFPTVAAPITVSYKLDGFDSLQLSPETIAKIFQREIKTWNDKAIAADNPGAKLPSTAIVVAHRSDGSGTTENFTKFLKAAAPTVWKLDSGSTVNWPADTQGGNGNSGVAQIVSGANGAIGYVDFSDAKASNLKWAKVKNKAGKFVDATLDGASAALAGVTINPDLSYNPLWADGEAAYPITAPTWILAYKDQTDKAKGAALKAFLQYIYGEGQSMTAEVNYAKLPDSLKDKGLAQVDQLVIPA
ncbi:MAG TPA: phosphate ABC transporter substrate-binding protein PstS [Acidimicrobiia bacterium]|jgi:phosphate transport system substrate-binding protein|nr:phosphate ABC transporter substrate-binding protein PstS [Acidimicrobiia bacterium]